MHSILLKIGPLTIYTYGFMIALGVIMAFLLSMRQAKLYGLDADEMFNLGTVGIVAGIIGAKVFYLIVELPDIINNPSLLLDVSNGFVVFGGLVCGFLAPYIYCRKKKIRFLPYLDTAVPQVALAQGFGRIGCFFAGCCYGKVTHAWYGVVFPENTQGPGGVPLIPTQLISSFLDFLLAFMLAGIHKKDGTAGRTTSCYLILYSAGRFLVEYLRGDPRGNVGVFSTTQFFTLFSFGAGILLFIITGKQSSASREEKKV
ncbi:MAG: prolipoprotein diacylglyceryl transferase [Parasporobacterium sp.]|nr:prolipoprotein diacylglyceryl transferase [Parasporobacterium sp.]